MTSRVEIGPGWEREVAPISGKELLSSSSTMQPKAWLACNPLCCVPVSRNLPLSCNAMLRVASVDRDKMEGEQKFRSSTRIPPCYLVSRQRNSCSLYRDTSRTREQRQDNYYFSYACCKVNVDSPLGRLSFFLCLRTICTYTLVARRRYRLPEDLYAYLGSFVRNGAKR